MVTPNITVLQYIHGSDWESAAVSAYSMRLNGNLPSNTKYIMRTDTPDEIPKSTLGVIWDSIEPPVGPWEKFRDTMKSRKDMKGYHERNIWQYVKTCQLLYQPVEENGYVILIDNDVLITGSMMDALPKAPCTHSGRDYRIKGWIGINTGLVIKNSLFGDAERALLTKITYDSKEWLNTLKRTHMGFGDEHSWITYYRIYGAKTLNRLDKRYNFGAVSFVKNRRSIEDMDVRMVHWLGPNKPTKFNRPPLLKLNSRWFAMRNKVRELIKQNEC